MNQRSRCYLDLYSIGLMERLRVQEVCVFQVYWITYLYQVDSARSHKFHHRFTGLFFLTCLTDLPWIVSDLMTKTFFTVSRGCVSCCCTSITAFFFFFFKKSFLSKFFWGQKGVLTWITVLLLEPFKTFFAIIFLFPSFMYCSVENGQI